MKLVSLLTLFLLTINSAFAQNAVKLNKDEKAPFKGVLVTEAKIIELDKAKRSNIVLKDLGVAKDDLIDYHRKDAQTQREKLSAAKFDSNLKAIGYFVLGSILTALTFKINQKVGDL